MTFDSSANNQAGRIVRFPSVSTFGGVFGEMGLFMTKLMSVRSRHRPSARIAAGIVLSVLVFSVSGGTAGATAAAGCTDAYGQSSTSCTGSSMTLSAAKKHPGQTLTVRVTGLPVKTHYRLYNNITRHTGSSVISGGSEDTVLAKAKSSLTGTVKVTFRVPRDWIGQQYLINIAKTYNGARVNTAAWLTVVKAGASMTLSATKKHPGQTLTVRVKGLPVKTHYQLYNNVTRHSPSSGTAGVTDHDTILAKAVSSSSGTVKVTFRVPKKWTAQQYRINIVKTYGHATLKASAWLTVG